MAGSSCFFWHCRAKEHSRRRLRADLMFAQVTSRISFEYLLNSRCTFTALRAETTRPDSESDTHWSEPIKLPIVKSMRAARLIGVRRTYAFINARDGVGDEQDSMISLLKKSKSMRSKAERHAPVAIFIVATVNDFLGHVVRARVGAIIHWPYLSQPHPASF